MPERFLLPGIQHAQRYLADGDFPEHLVAARAPLEDVGSVVNERVSDDEENGRIGARW